MEGSELSRRTFLEQAAAAGLVYSLVAGAARAAEDEEKVWPEIGVGLIGCGPQGRVLLEAIAKLPWAKIRGLSDSYAGTFRRAKELAPDAATHEDYKALLADPAVQAVFIATPSHLHKPIALDAVAAGKHVYCEAPLAGSIDDAREIAKAAAAATTRFCAGMHLRAAPLYPHSKNFVVSGVLRNVVSCRAQYRKKDSWYRAGASEERERELNWRLRHESSLGLIGEIGIHPVDYICWALNQRPKRVSGKGAVLAWKDDGREVADTVSAVYELADGVPVTFDATLGGSYGGEGLVMVGTDGTIYLHGDTGWLIKEADAPQMGWEIYARKDDLLGETGIMLVANATKLLEEDKLPSEVANHGMEPGKDRWFYTIEHFLQRCCDGGDVACSALDGFRAVVLAAKGNEAVRGATTIEFTDDMFELG